MILCPKCKIKLIKLPFKMEDGTLKEFYIHPTTIQKCEYGYDGVELEITDRIMFNHFQEIIKSEKSKIKKVISLFRDTLRLNR